MGDCGMKGAESFLEPGVPELCLKDKDLARGRRT